MKLNGGNANLVCDFAEVGLFLLAMEMFRRAVVQIVIILVTGIRGKEFDPFALPRLLANTDECPLNPCEVLKIMSQYFMIMQTNLHVEHERTRVSNDYADGNDPFSTELSFDKRIRQVERRLQAVEQPIWTLREGVREEWNHCTEGVCRCTPDTKTFSCWNGHLKAIPSGQIIPMDIVNIDISGNQLTTLNKDTFHGLTHLIELDLSNNKINFLPHDLLQDLDGLVQLRLQSNELDDLHYQIFYKLRNLNLLDMSKNSLISLPDNLFHHNQKLSVINLSDNKLVNIPMDFFKEQMRLQELDLSRNEIEQLKDNSFKNVFKLKILELSKNQIETLQENTFWDLLSLETLSLHNNRIVNITTNLFANLTKLTMLDLTMNRIAKIENGAFSSLVKLEELYLGQNSLTTIPKDQFLNLENLKRLMLFSNNLATLESDDFVGLKSLKHLMLNNNVVKSFNAHVFQPLQSLEKLRIDSNKLQSLPINCLENLQNLLSVKLDKNPWHCDCRTLYLARWLRASPEKLWDSPPVCRGPGDLGGVEVGYLRYDDLCDGQWASMLSLSPRLPVRKNRISQPKNFTDYINLYLRHMISTTTEAAQEIAGESTTITLIVE